MNLALVGVSQSLLCGSCTNNIQGLIEWNKIISIIDKWLTFLNSILNSLLLLFTNGNICWPCKYKQLIIDSLQFLNQQKRVRIFSFVIMNNHLHIIWQVQPPHTREDVQRDFLKYAAQKIPDDLKKNHPAVLTYFEVAEKDREV